MTFQNSEKGPQLSQNKHQFVYNSIKNTTSELELTIQTNADSTNVTYTLPSRWSLSSAATAAPGPKATGTTHRAYIAQSATAGRIQEAGLAAAAEEACRSRVRNSNTEVVMAVARTMRMAAEADMEVE
jgi:hypothetical protein